MHWSSSLVRKQRNAPFFGRTGALHGKPGQHTVLHYMRPQHAAPLSLSNRALPEQARLGMPGLRWQGKEEEGRRQRHLTAPWGRRGRRGVVAVQPAVASYGQKNRPPLVSEGRLSVMDEAESYLVHFLYMSGFSSMNFLAFSSGLVPGSWFQAMTICSCAGSFQLKLSKKA